MKYANNYKSIYFIKKKLSPLLCVIILLGVFSSSGISQNVVTWIGTTNSDWENTDNWNTQTLPNTDSEVRINLGTLHNPVINAGVTANCKTLLIGTPGDLNVLGTLNVNPQDLTKGAVLIAGNMHVGGTLNVTNAQFGIALNPDGNLTNLLGTINIGMTGSPIPLEAIDNTGTIELLGPLNIGSAGTGINNRIESGSVFQATFTNNDALIQIGTGAHVITGQAISNTAKFVNLASIKIDNAAFGIANFNVSTDLSLFENHARIDIGLNGTISNQGVFNQDDFFNFEFASLHIDNTGGTAFNNKNNKFSDHECSIEGDLFIGQNGPNNSIGGLGIYNDTLSNIVFSNAIVSIDHTTFSAINNVGFMDNFGTLNIGQNEPSNISIQDFGLVNQGSFRNKNGTIKIDRVVKSGILNIVSPHPNAAVTQNFTNEAIINIGSSIFHPISINANGISNQGVAFTNRLEGSISINRCSGFGITNIEGTLASTVFTNEGSIVNNVNTADGSIVNDKTFLNSSCAALEVGGRVFNNPDAVITNHGYFEVNTSTAVHVNSGSFTNNGIIHHSLGNPIPNVTNNEIIVNAQTIPASACPILNLPDILVANALDMNITMWQDFNLTETAGTYDPATGTLDMSTAVSPPRDGASILYIHIDDLNNGCSQVLFWVVMIDNPDVDNDRICDDLDLCPNDRDISLHFSAAGGSDYIEVPNDPELNLTDGDFAFEAWINPTTGDYKTIVSKGDGGGGSPTSYIFGIMSNTDVFFNQPGKLGLYLNDQNGNAEWIFSNTSIPLHTWSHVAVSVNNAGANPVVTFYFNGVPDGGGTSSFSTLYNNDMNPFYIGRQGSGCQCNFFDGRIDELAVWDKALSASDIVGSMAAPYAGTETFLVAYYDFNDADACVTNTANTSLTDLANGHDGTLINFDLSIGCVSNWTSGHNVGACEPINQSTCPPNLNLGGTQSNDKIFQTDGYISSDQYIVSPSIVDYNATTEINLLKNFEVEQGTLFHAYILGCGGAVNLTNENIK